MGTISIEHGDHLYWLGRYTERAFTTLTALQKTLDKLIDTQHGYTDYLAFFGLTDVYTDNMDFIENFLYNAANQNSIAFNLERAYDNGIVLREEISTETLSFLQMAKDTLAASKKTMNPRMALLSLEDLLYGFWGCLYDHLYDEEMKNIVKCGKAVERLDLYLRMEYSYSKTKKEYARLCANLKTIPENTPYRFNPVYFEKLSETFDSPEIFAGERGRALSMLGHIFDKEESIA